MASPDALGVALGARLKTISGLTAYDRWPNQLNPPCAVIGEPEGEPEQTFGRGDLTKWAVDLYVFVSLAGGYDNALKNISPYLATSSTGGVYGAIHADRTLGGVAHSTFIRRIGRPEQLIINDHIEYVGAIVSCEVWAS